MTKTAFITVDNSLVNANNQLIESTVSRIKELKKQGYTIILWSSRGRKYCESVVEVHQLKKLVDFCVAKPDLVIDSDDFPLRSSKLEAPKYLKREFV